VEDAASALWPIDWQWLERLEREEYLANDDAPPARQVKSYRSIWISDLHLGTPRCQATNLVDFLRHCQVENLYLVGDIVDGWVWGRFWYWSAAQSAVVKQITRLHRLGARVVFLPGNHDEFSGDLVQSLFGPVPVVANLIHRTAEGRRMLVVHGHQFDGSLNPNRLLSVMGSQAYAAALRVDNWYNNQRLELDRVRRSLGVYVKTRLKRAVQYLTDFDDRAVLRAVREHKADGIICGHIHRAEQRQIGGIQYFNDGDWVESSSAVVEEQDGALRVVRWDAENACQEVTESLNETVVA
jgi:UDP-2,3-diacylglucosamine pyrophosphatase LpxH